jgi:hypothetical protein
MAKLKFLSAIGPPKGKKPPAHSVVAIKKIVKTVQGLGLSVTGVKAQPDGSFFVETTNNGENAASGSYWDKVLPK